ncbi:non-homologous end-joining DNA ligase [Streptomyces bohaiensis]|uniref:DNA polymerase domain-containing protein n=1 Tax=Streptomyces bohaiensis TaxID=1431344 RepID=A0ABX1C5A9_9ACTN|nr:non-homologous end-joining DNA ligase [Streptomyces bohaiensis]NJQ14387.1 DNA polymerase domain-containing protein [Streptomyces bohaiensis]
MVRYGDPLELTVGDRTVRVTSPDKTFFPARGWTKRDVAEYYLAVGDGAARALRDRPTTLERFPDGVDGESFFQKRAPRNLPEWIPTAEITFPSGRTAQEVCPRDAAAVVWAANLGTLTFHPWPVRRDAPDHPDEMRIDLDPQPGTGFADAARVALSLREVLADFGLTGRPKTSGGRGLHVFVPIVAAWSFVEVRRAVITVGRELERREPGRVTTSWWKEERGERVFVDFNQMARDRTMASAYSVRPHPHAQVSAPLRWEEVADVSPADFDIMTMRERFASVGDVHAGTGEEPGRLEQVLEQADRDVRDRGLGDLPYPPDHPKMAGEPKRVQPSRAKDA